MFEFYVSCSDENNLFHEIRIFADSAAEVLEVIERDYWGITHVWEIVVRGPSGV